MAEAKKPVAFDPWTTPKETWKYITIPDEDPTGKKFPTIMLNKISFSAGETYHLPVAVADHVNDRVKVFNRSVMRLFNPNVDMDALTKVSAGSASGASVNYVDASKVTTL